MAEIEVATFEQIATLMSHLMTNYTNMSATYYTMFYSTTPQDITIKLYDSDGNLKEYVVPNRAKDFNYTLNGSGNPEGVVSANVGTTFQDTTNGKLYIKESASGDVTGWTLVGSNEQIKEGDGSPEGVRTENKGTLYIDKTNANLYIKLTESGNTGWELISANTTSLADKDLSNLSTVGEAHFADPSLSNLTNAGNTKFADPSLSNLSSTGTAKFTVKEDKSNKVTSISSSSTDVQYPSAKATYDTVNTTVTTTVNTIVGDLANLTTTNKGNVVAAVNEVNAKDPVPSQTGHAGEFLYTNGTSASWAQAIPVGTIFYFTKSTAPEGFLICDGSAISRTTYSDLFTTISTTFGKGDSSTTFNLPNLIDKFPQGNTTIGTVKAAGLPNITGQFTFGGATFGQYSGAFYYKSASSSEGAYDTYGNSGLAGFSAAISSSVYGNSTTVQPPALTLLPCIKY